MPLAGEESDGIPVISYVLTGLDGTVLAQREPDREFYAASTVKLAVLVAAMRAVDAGTLDLDQQLTAQHRWASSVEGAPTFGQDDDEIDAGMPAPGQSIALRDVLWRMVAVSSNEATNMTVGLVGLDSIARAFADAGAASSRMERLIGDSAARAAGRTHAVTARDLVALLRHIVTGALTSPASTAVMISLLEDQEFAYLGEGLPPGTRFGSKSGWVTGIQHDVAYICPDGELAGPGAYVFAVCTRGYAEPDATELLATLSNLVWTQQTR